MTQKIKRIVLTPGEPAGIGPDLCCQLAQTQLDCELVVIASPELMAQRSQQLGLALNISEFDHTNPVKKHVPGKIKIIPVELAKSVKCGKLEQQNSQYVVKCITRATQSCLQNKFDAMVTGPVHKGNINDAGIAFLGHTEYIAGITGGQPVMMLATEGLRVALVTTHLPLQQVSQAITRHRLRTVIRVLHQDLVTNFSLASPKIMVCGLNPHAGEGGHLGREEIEIISPVLESLRQHGMDLQGPLPADTVFTPKYLKTADVVLAMYHDQGLPVLKHMGFGQAVNITLGLPVIRTSVDHGTALELAGTGEIDCGSMQLAVNTAITMADNFSRL